MRRFAVVLVVLAFAGAALRDAMVIAQTGCIPYDDLCRLQKPDTLRKDSDSSTIGTTGEPWPLIYAEQCSIYDAALDTVTLQIGMVPDDSAGAYLGAAATPFSHIWGDTLHGVFTGWADSAHYATLAESAAVSAYADSATNCYHATFADSSALCGSATQADSAIVAWYADSAAAAVISDTSAASGHSDTADSSGDAASADLCVVAVQATDSSWIDDDLTITGTLLLTPSTAEVFGVQSMGTPSGLTGTVAANNRHVWYPSTANTWYTGSTDITNLLPRGCTILTVRIYGSLADNGDSCYAYLGRCSAGDGNAPDTREATAKTVGAVAYYGTVATITQDCVVTAGDSLTLLYPCLYGGGTNSHARISAILINYESAQLP